MSIPSKGINFTQLSFSSDIVPKSGHIVRKATFVNADGETVTCFYKKVDNDGYPALLARYCVAFSVRMRLALGSAVAEERLVYDENENIIGSISILIPGFKPMAYWGETQTDDPETCPDSADLLHHNVVKLLVSLFMSYEDDGHPGNLGVKGVIDRDMTFYWLLCLIRGKRIIDGVLKDLPTDTLKSNQLHNFPIISGRNHWPTNNYPDNGAVWNGFLSSASFQALAKNPRHYGLRLKTEEDRELEVGTIYVDAIGDSLHYWLTHPDNDNEIIHATIPLIQLVPTIVLPLTLPQVEACLPCILKITTERGHTNAQSEALKGSLTFQDQMFSAILMELLLYDPQLLSARLTDYLGDAPFSFKELSGDRPKKLTERYPELFTNEANEKSMVVHLNDLFHRAYNKFYCITVFYLGCEKNIKGVYVKSFFEFLDSTPLAHEAPIAFAKTQNELSEQAWARHQPDSNLPGASLCIRPESRYNIVRIEQRHQALLRNARAPILLKLLSDFKTVIQLLQNDFKMSPIQPIRAFSPMRNLQYENITDSSQLFPELTIDESPDGIAIEILSKFKWLHVELSKAIKAYVDLRHEQLTLPVNSLFCQNIYALIQMGTPAVDDKLFEFHWKANAPEHLQMARRLIDGVEYVCQQLDLTKPAHERKQLAKNTPLNPYIAQAVNYDHRHEKVVKAGVTLLFSWAHHMKKHNSAQFNAIMLTCLNKYKPYSLNVLAKKNRFEPIMQYLEENQHDDGANILGYILSHGEITNTSLNYIIVKTSMDFISQTLLLEKRDIALIHIRAAFDDETFTTHPYVALATQVARTNHIFDHICSIAGVERFYSIFYKQIVLMDKNIFNACLKKAHEKYIDKPMLLSIFYSKRRVVDIDNYCAERQDFLIAKIFSAGKTEKSSLNTGIFTNLVQGMQNSIRVKERRTEDENFFLKFRKEHRELYLQSLQQRAKDYLEHELAQRRMKRGSHVGNKGLTTV